MLFACFQSILPTWYARPYQTSQTMKNESLHICFTAPINNCSNPFSSAANVLLSHLSSCTSHRRLIRFHWELKRGAALRSLKSNGGQGICMTIGPKLDMLERHNAAVFLPVNYRACSATLSPTRSLSTLIRTEDRVTGSRWSISLASSRGSISLAQAICQ